MDNNFILKCPLGEDRITEMKRNIFTWLTEPALSSLVVAFGDQVPKTSDVKELARWYLVFSDRWDFRKQQQAFDKKVNEGARWLVGNDSINEIQKKLIAEASLKLGLGGNNIPSLQNYDYVLVLGGAKLSCLLRCRLAAQTINRLSSAPNAVVLLASTRPIGDGEREATNTYAIEAETEFDLFVSAGNAEFKLSRKYTGDKYDDPFNSNSSWTIRKYEAENNQYEVVLLAAPSSDPDKRRANSVDTFDFFFKHFNIPADSKLLLVTSQIYVPYQHMEAIRSIALPDGILIDTIGFPSEWGGVLQGMNEPSNYLQEIRSTIQSFNRFFDSYE